MEEKVTELRNYLPIYFENKENNEYVEYLTSEEIYKQKSHMPIIDQIDCVLAKHYGFTDEELDFIINYDIKHRMGRESEEGDI